MNEQDKELLQDLCARLPYGVIIHFNEGIGEDDQVLYCCRKNGKYTQFNDGYFVDEFKPYLRPMSSMTIEEGDTITKLCGADNATKQGALFVVGGLVESETLIVDYYTMQSVINYLLSRHFDVHGLIEKGLALNAPEGMYD